MREASPSAGGLRESALNEPAPEPRWTALLGAMALYALTWLSLAWPWLSGRVTIPWDAKAQFAPQVQFLASSIARGESPFWNPYVFAGHPQIADPQAMILSVPYLLLAVLNPAPSLWAIDATELVAILIGGLATILWFHDRDWHWAGGVIAGLGVTFGAAMAWRVQHVGQVLSLVHLPIVLVLLDRALARGSVLYGAGAGLAGALLVLGRDQVALLSCYLLAGYVLDHLARGPLARKRAIRPLAGALVTGLAIVTVPLVLTALFAFQSNRPSIDFEGAGRGSLHPAHALTLFVSDLYGASGEFGDYWGPPSVVWKDTGLILAQNMGVLYIGALPVLLLALAAGSGWLWAREIRVFTIALAVALIYALGWYTPAFQLLHAHVPGVDLYRRPADAVFLIGFLMATLAGYGAHRLLRATERPGALAVGFAAAATFGGFATVASVVTYFGRWSSATPEVLKALAMTAGSALALMAAYWLNPIRPKFAGLLVVAVLAGDLASNDDPNGATGLKPAEYEVLEPGSSNRTIARLKALVANGAADTQTYRVELAGLGFHWPNASMTHRLENTLGYNPLRLGRYSTATGAEDNVGLPEERRFSPLFPSYRSTLADLLGLRYIATPGRIEDIDPRLEPGDLRLIGRDRDGLVYENPRAYPRVHFATEAQAANFGKLLRDGRWPAADLTRAVLLESALEAGPLRRKGRVAIVARTNTSVAIETDSPDGGWVVLNDLWHPWWFATLDGAPVAILRANVLFRAVPVPPGPHTVRFEFHPLKGAWAELWGRRDSGR